jgi:hypothetical protein
MNAPSPATTIRLESAAHALRTRLDATAQTLAEYEAEIAPIRDRFTARLRRHASDIRTAREAVLELIAAHPALFVKPKSRVVHGIKLGLRKAADRWAWPADDALVGLIQERCTPEQQAAYLVTTTVGRKDAIPPEERARLGVGCTPGTDTPVCEEQATTTGEALVALLAQIPQEER